MKKRIAVGVAVLLAFLLVRHWFFRRADEECEWVTVIGLYWNTANGKDVIKAKTLERGWIDVTWEVETRLRGLPRRYRFSKTGKWSPYGGKSERYSVILEEKPYEGPPIPFQHEDFNLPWWSP
jgi:hypothetical protein